MFDTIHNHYHQVPPEEWSKVVNKLNQLMAKLDAVNQEIADLKTQVADLQTSVDAEQAQITQLLETNAAVVTGLNEQIAALQAAAEGQPTQEDIDAVVTSLQDLKSSIATTKEDISATVSDNASPGEES